MKKFVLHLYDILSKHKWMTLAFLIVCLGLCIYSASRMHYQEDISAFLPKDEMSSKYESVYANNSGQSRIVVIFSSDNENQEDIVEAMDTFGAKWAEADTIYNIKDMQIRVDETQVLEVMNFIEDNIPYFLSDKDYARMDSLLSDKEFIGRQLNGAKKMLMLPSGGTVTANVRRDPLSLFSPVLQRLQQFRSSDTFSTIDGCVFTSDGNKGLAFFSSPYGMSESVNNEKLAHFLNGIADSTMSVCPNVTISAVGAPLIAVTNARQIKTDSILAISISLILIVLLLTLSFKRFQDILWICISILTGWIIAIGCFALYKDNISIIILGIGSVIIGIAVNYPLHYLDRLKYDSNKKQVLKDIIQPLVVGNITTVGAFLCLAFLNASAMRDFGIFASLVLVGTIIFVIIFLPVFVKARPYSQTSQKDNLTPKFNRLFEYEPRRKSVFLIPIIIITLVLWWLGNKTSFDADLHNINYMTAAQKADMNILQGSLQTEGTDRIYAVAEGKDMETALRTNEILLTSVENLSKDTSCHIASVSGPGGFLPSKELQRKKLEKWNSFCNKYSSYIIENLSSEAKKTGFSPKAFSPFTSLLTKEFEVCDVDYMAPITNSLAASYIFEKEDGVMIVNYVDAKGEAGPLKERLKESIPEDSFIFDSNDVGVKLVSILSDEFNYIGLVCGLIVFFFLWLSFGKLELSLLSFLPLAVSWIWILGIMDIFGIQFNIVNIILATFIFGQGDDYTIFITEGLMYEYAYNKKMIVSYKKSVALSALIMFVGIGSLIVAKHPAMHSLAQVTIIGMITVVAMAYYLPPLVFRWLTQKKGVIREFPVTIKRLLYSIYSFSFFILAIFLIVRPVAFFYFTLGKTTEKKREKYHKLLQKIAAFAINNVPGTTFTLNNISGETFEKPAVIISNHQSHLDLMCVMMLAPKLVIMTNDWVWNNPFYGKIIRKAEFYPASEGYDNYLDKLQSLVERGYSIVVFPEGTRSIDSSILRFHKGAFYLAEKLNLDIVPVMLHGVGQVLPKRDFMLRQGKMSVEIDKRVPASDLTCGNGYRERTSYFHRYYKSRFEEIRNQREDASYFIPFVRYKYLYKGKSIETMCRKFLSRREYYVPLIDFRDDSVKTVLIMNSGQGEFALMFAWVHRDMEIFAFDSSEENRSLSCNISRLPSNLHFISSEKEIPQNDKCIIIK